jgi:CBS domain-containing protein
MLARDIMSTPVISVESETPVLEIAALLVDRRISGVPVLRDGRLVGMINEMELVHRHEIGTELHSAPAPWWARLFRADHTASQYVKAHAVKAKDVMLRTPVSVPEDAELSEIAVLFDSRRIRRLPVVRAGKLVGIITRADLVAALAVHAQIRPAEGARSDEEIRTALLAKLRLQPWWRPDWSNVTVTDGVVKFRGVVDTRDEKRAARVAAENVAGVRGVEDLRQRYSDMTFGL